MRKYFALAKIEILDSLEYRYELILWQIIELVPILTLAMVWLTLGTNKVGDYSISQLITYYLVSAVTSRLVEYHFAYYQADNIRTGKFSLYLLKPITLIKAFYSSDFPSQCFMFIVTTIPLITVVWGLLNQYLVFPTLMNMLFFLLMVGMGNVINFLLQMILVAMAFFFKSIEGLRHTQWMANAVFGGAMIPLVFLPRVIQNISSWLPFKLMYFVPISIYMGNFDISEIILNLGYGVLWIGGLVIFSNWLWGRALKRYSAVGA